MALLDTDTHATTRTNAIDVDDLLIGLQGTFLNSDLYDPSQPHPRLSQYKEKRLGYGDQESRRKRLLEEQKSRRSDQANYARRIAFGRLEDSDEEMEDGRGITLYIFIHNSILHTCMKYFRPLQ